MSVTAAPGKRSQSEGKVEAQCLVESSDVDAGQGPDPCAYPLDRDGSNLFSLRLRVAGKAGRISGEENLKGVDSFDVRRHWHNGYRSALAWRSR